MIENTPPLLPGENGKDAASHDHSPSDRVVVNEVPIAGIGETIDAILREPGRVHAQIGQAGGLRLLCSLVMLIALGLAAYGFVVGTFTGGIQLWAAPLKIGGGMLISGLICLPSLYIFTCLAGGRASFRQVLGLVAGLIAIMTLLLIGFAPVAWVFSQSTESVATMGVLHLLFWGVAMVFAVRFFRSGFGSVVAAKETGLLRLWLTVFVVVVLQMSTALRPIIGQSETLLPGEKKFFAEHWLDSLQISQQGNRFDRSRGD
ncbi:MAG: hypothetical protein ISQ14_15475 [Verrucomicrobiae bacterium]|jgi:hypothetical protein|nr:hypothetical protein [Verrucomicrobiae bacterium]